MLKNISYQNKPQNIIQIVLISFPRTKHIQREVETKKYWIFSRVKISKLISFEDMSIILGWAFCDGILWIIEAFVHNEEINKNGFVPMQQTGIQNFNLV